MEIARDKSLFLKEGERLDDLQRNGYQIIQNPEKFCFGIDAVLLSGFATAKRGDKVLDLGCGTGIIPILMAAKTDADVFYALEIQEESADMARRSVEINDLQKRIHIVSGDIKEAANIFDPASFDVVTTNPPYMISGHGIKNPDSPKAIARHEVLCDLSDVCRAASYCLKNSGKLYMVHRPFRLAEIIRCMSEYHIEPKRMRLVYPYADKEPSIVLIEGAKGGKPRMTVEPPLIIYEDKNKYSAEMVSDYGF
ncbi:MAG: tRNA1(Val) (adenine(37)-N6)-methyltransferase [Butyrivibrio sp.]|uniref:tRNA1(Val) (adenine(37)-N6)-methyltransferase n=1 Tax=Butyrivibrio sp. NC2002 TaxID=1410610 RepID=UPI00055D004E|nr:tRNA1(Val) (adenine(37)-N6)-methyltransferase [Butyrivibrio sp. NC2002]MBE5859223.1 tRNA1(Val) (adenine(37)-N6)-methyltransferase [Butyrivibrio sp.]